MDWRGILSSILDFTVFTSMFSPDIYQNYKLDNIKIKAVEDLGTI